MPDKNEDLLEAPIKKSERAPAKKSASKKAAKKTVAKKTTTKKAVRKPAETLTTIIKQQPEPIVSANDILKMAGPATKTQDDEGDEFDQMNPLVDKKPDVISDKNVADFFPDDTDLPKAEHIVRKVSLKKISRFDFRLGMEKWNDKYKPKMVPGTSQTWMCDKKGDEFVTGLDKYPQERERLEKLLRVSLSNTSSYYAELTFEMEDKEHGQIMNFDDRQLGPYYEVVYFAMLASPLVANGLHEYTTGVKPFAEWYIENKEAEAEIKEKIMDDEIEAVEYFSKMTLTRRKHTAKLLGLPVWGITEKAASSELWDYISQGKDEKKKQETSAEFLKLARLGDTEFLVKVLVKDAVKLNVLRRDGIGNLKFGDETLGPTEEHVVNKIALPTNATLRLSIERQVKAKNK